MRHANAVSATRRGTTPNGMADAPGSAGAPRRGLVVLALEEINHDGGWANPVFEGGRSP